LAMGKINKSHNWIIPTHAINSVSLSREAMDKIIENKNNPRYAEWSSMGREDPNFRVNKTECQHKTIENRDKSTCIYCGNLIHFPQLRKQRNIKEESFDR